MTGGPRRWLPVALAAGLAIGLGLWFASGDEFSLDDAYIHLSYAKSLRMGEGLSYNPNDSETGFSSPLWVLLLASFPIERDPHGVVKGIGVVLHLLTALLAGGLAWTLARREFGLEERAAAWAAGVAGCAVAATAGLLQAASSGMEVGLAGLLCLACGWTVARDRPLPGLAAGALATLARPESLVFVALLIVPALATTRRPRAAAPAVGAFAALALWCGYNLVVSGYPLPNTHYAKTTLQFLPSLEFLALRVFGASAWVLGLAGLVLIATALRGTVAARATTSLGLALGWVAVVAATALSHPLNPDVLFFHQRYFLVYAAVPWILVGVGVARSPGRWSRIALLPTLVVVAWLLPAQRARMLDQETDILNNHVRVGRHVAAALPPGTTLMVEGAGAIRYYAPREIRVVDLLGLNDREIAHAQRDASRLACLYAERDPDYIAFPDEFTEMATNLFVGEVVEEFHEPSYAQLATVRPRSVYLARLSGPNPVLAARCAQARP